MSWEVPWEVLGSLGKPLACRPLLLADIPDRPFLMQGSAGYF